MANVTSSYLVAGGSNSYLAAEYLVRRIGEEAAQVANIAPLVWYQDLTGQSTMVGHFRNLVPLGNATTQTEAAALTVVSWSPVGETITCGLEGFSVVESKVVNSLAPAALDQIALQGGTSLARTVDAALAALFPSFTGGTVGTSGSALTVTNMITGEAKLDAQYVVGKRYGIIHPQAFGDLKIDMSSKNYGISRITADATGAEQIEIGTLIIRKNGLVPKINTNADYAGGLFVEEALGLCVADRPQVEILPLPGQHAFTIDCTVAFGVGVTRPLFGVLTQSGINA